MKGKEICIAAESSLKQGQFREALDRAEGLLRQYPGHLRGMFLAAVARIRLGESQHARLLLDAALGLDPENAECRLALAEALHTLGEAEQSTRQFVRAFALCPSDADQKLVLGSRLPAVLNLKSAGEATPLGKAVRFKLSVNWGGALPEFQAITRSDPFLPEAWLGLAETLWQLERLDEAMSTLDQIAAAWPNFVKAALIRGDILIRRGQAEAGTASLHAAQALDPSGIVAERAFGAQGQYRLLWADPSDLPDAASDAPAQRGAKLRGEQVVAAGTEAAPLPQSPTLRDIQAEMARLTDHLMATDDSQPPERLSAISALAILTCRTTLEAKFGSDFTQRLGEAVHRLVKAIGPADNRAIHFVALDDPEQMTGLGAVAAQNPADPAHIKAAVDSLADGLLTQGQDMRHVLILGGDDIVPFYRTANPTDDQDEDIYTDAPYAARNGSSLLPTRAVGRLPDCDDPDAFLRLIEHAAKAHADSERNATAKGLKALRRIWQRGDDAPSPEDSFGYTASVWKEASRAVFEVIGQTRHLRMSPPISRQEFSALAQSKPRLAYFNLHGVEGEPAWYGQRDPDFAADYPLFPVALLPDDIASAWAAGATVLTEACYGADVLARTHHDSIALRFLHEGARAVVGSTRLAYGSLTPPLAGADLLGRLFWLAVTSGMPIGQALQWAKLSFANDLMNRQGYLDSEDQKTLLTFNLFGDPTLTVEGQKPIWDKLPQAATVRKSLAVCCQHSAHRVAADVPDDLVQQVQSQISHRLPWLAPKQVRVTQQVLCNGQCTGSCHSGAASHSATAIANRYVFTVSGAPEGDGLRGPLVAKITVDHKGTILKMAVSK
ncbi:MAG: tetratricopeptide repeat protein [Chloroflexi bacterium]|nr:tetratricopeptide repeat protein [Chloroflexota bacterium]